MLTYCLRCKKGYRKCKSVRANCKTMLSSKCAIYCSKKSRFMKEQKAKELLSSLGLKEPLSNILLQGNILF